MKKKVKTILNVFEVPTMLQLNKDIIKNLKKPRLKINSLATFRFKKCMIVYE